MNNWIRTEVQDKSSTLKNHNCETETFLFNYENEMLTLKAIFWLDK